MKAIALFLMATMLMACGPVLVVTKQRPMEKTEAQQQLDEISCGQVSQVSYYPLLFGLGIPLSRQLAKTRYSECMEGRGYVVEK